MRHFEFTDRSQTTCDCDAGRDHLDDGTPVLSLSRAVDQRILVAQGPALYRRALDKEDPT